jgi:hypothetical protein
MMSMKVKSAMLNRRANVKWSQLDRDLFEAMQSPKVLNKRIQRLIDHGYSIKHYAYSYTVK